MIIQTKKPRSTRKQHVCFPFCETNYRSFSSEKFIKSHLRSYLRDGISAVCVAVKSSGTTGNEEKVRHPDTDLHSHTLLIIDAEEFWAVIIYSRTSRDQFLGGKPFVASVRGLLSRDRRYRLMLTRSSFSAQFKNVWNFTFIPPYTLIAQV
jgi:hypothetical protein